MPDAVYTYRMPAGIPGEVTRFQTVGTTIEAQMQNQATPVIRFGQAVVIDSNGARPVAAGDTAAPAYVGISVRPFPGSDAAVGNVPFGAGTPLTDRPIDILRRGYISVKVDVGTPAKGDAVYVYYGATSGANIQAGFQAGAGANKWLLPGAFFTGAIDANGNSEVAFWP